MADSKLSALYVSNPIILEPEDLGYAVDDPGGTPASAGYKFSQLMHNRYRIVVTVSSNDLVVSLKHLDGTTDPSTTKPLYFKIGNSLRAVTAATSITIADGTLWFNSGSAELATQLVPYFTYAVWDSNSSIVALTIARKPYYRTVASTMSTATSENHIYGYSGLTDGDDMVNIGYFEATLSAGAGYTWTVPTFTNDNLKHEPTFESRLMTYTVSTAAGNLTQGSGGAPTTVTDTAKYRIRGRQLFEKHNIIVTNKNTAAGFLRVAHPFTLTAIESMAGVEYLMVGYSIIGIGATTTAIHLWKYDLTTLWQNGHEFIASGWFEIP